MEPIWLILPVATLPITLLAKLPPLLTEEAYIWPPIPPAAASPKRLPRPEGLEPGVVVAVLMALFVTFRLTTPARPPLANPAPKPPLPLPPFVLTLVELLFLPPPKW